MDANLDPGLQRLQLRLERIQGAREGVRHPKSGGAPAPPPLFPLPLFLLSAST